MAGISDAVSLDRISRAVGYKIEKGFPPVGGVNLPIRIAVLGCANETNEATAPTVATEITSAAKAGEKWGFGSPVHQAMRILRPENSDGVGAIPTYVYSQSKPAGAVAAARSITVAATVTKNTTHTVVVNGRSNVDGSSYAYTVLTTDDADAIALKIVTAINSVLSSPVIALIDGVTSNQVNITSKYAGLISEELEVSVNVADQAAGVTYVIASEVVGAGEHVIGSPFGSEWNTFVINPYGSTASVLDRLEAINGIPETTSPTGNYTATAFKPFVAYFGSRESVAATAKAVVAARTLEVTNAAAPAPNSKGTTVEAAANMGYLAAIVAQYMCNLDCAGQSYPDMPVPSDGDIGDFADYNERDGLAKAGFGTVNLIAEQYQIQDPITTYRPAGETPPQFRYVRDLVLDWNVYYGDRILTDLYVRDKTIVADDQVVVVNGIVKPKMIKGNWASYAADLAARALITDPQFMIDSIQVGINGTNPQRLDKSFRYKRTGTSRIVSTDAEANFTFTL